MIPIYGVINVTGEVGTGKTSFGLEYKSGGPGRIAILNFDTKAMDAFIEVTESGGFYRSYARILIDTGTYSDPETAMAEQVIEDINSFKDDQFDILICDAWELFSKTLISYVIEHKKELKKHWRGGNQFWLALEQAGHAKKVEAGILDVLQRKAKAVFVINHLGNEYNDKNEPTGRQLPYASEALAQKSAFRIWLRRNEPGVPVPVGLVIKNLGKHVYIEEIGAYRTISVLPERLSHAALPDWGDRQYLSLWDIINYYWEKPVGMRTLEPHEVMSDFERDMIRATLSVEELEAKESLPIDIQAKIRELSDKGVPPPMVFNRLKGEYPGLTLTQISKVLGE